MHVELFFRICRKGRNTIGSSQWNTTRYIGPKRLRDKLDNNVTSSGGILFLGFFLVPAGINFESWISWKCRAKDLPITIYRFAFMLSPLSRTLIPWAFPIRYFVYHLLRVFLCDSFFVCFLFLFFLLSLTKSSTHLVGATCGVGDLIFNKGHILYLFPHESCHIRCQQSRSIFHERQITHNI